MNRLQLELRRLYLTQPPAAQEASKGDTGSIDASPGDVSPVGGSCIDATLVDVAGQVRALVLELARPAHWAPLSAVWKGVQVDLELPAPAIAVNGKDGYQLWFSLAQATPAAQGWALLDALRLRYLGDVKPHRLTLLPLVDASTALPNRHADLLPALQEASGVWSAFLAPDLAPMFADEPWLDLPPNSDGQAKLLMRLASIQPAEFERALALLGRGPETDLLAVDAASIAQASSACPLPALVPVVAAGLGHAPAGESPDPKRFLQGVMNDASVPLALRIEAAKALLSCAQPAR
jgi:hypothetical protein